MPLEAEILLSGGWQNIQALEEALSIPELELIVHAKRDIENRHHRFLAALQGADLDDHADDEIDPVEEVRLQILAEKRGVSVEQIMFEESDSGLGYELEE